MDTEGKEVNMEQVVRKEYTPAMAIEEIKAGARYGDQVVRKEYTPAMAIEEIKAWIEKSDPEIVALGFGFPPVYSVLRVVCVPKGYTESAKWV